MIISRRMRANPDQQPGTSSEAVRTHRLQRWLRKGDFTVAGIEKNDSLDHAVILAALGGRHGSEEGEAESQCDCKGAEIHLVVDLRGQGFTMQQAGLHCV